ncbi:MAG: Fe-S protein [Ignavibacteria bacterium]|nr:MAG: Fe-S protein [Ignavibacteria bacterium]KAF0159288.1 MAG: Fe-S protein [Ignavibacteria bacterium]
MYKDEYVHSPCNNNCIMDFETKLCKGCYRTIEEIISWSIATLEEKKNILELINYRKEKNKSSS